MRPARVDYASARLMIYLPHDVTLRLFESAETGEEAVALIGDPGILHHVLTEAAALVEGL